jgi:hypothetical protein
MSYKGYRFFPGFFLTTGLLVITMAGLAARGFSADSRFAVRLSGGLGYLGLTEMNTGLRGTMNDIWVSFQGDLTSASTYNDLKMGTNFAVDVIYYLSPKIGVGVGAEFIRGRKTSMYSWTGPRAGSVSAEPLLTAIPLKAGLFFKLPLSGRLNFTADIGAGYYQASLDNTYAWEVAGIVPLTTERFKVSAWNPGFHGGIGLEYSLGSRLALFFEALGRVAKVKGLKGTVQYNQNTAQSATLYYYEQIIDTTWYPILDASVTAPATGPDTRNVREATIDLTGGSALIGLVIRF